MKTRNLIAALAVTTFVTGFAGAATIASYDASAGSPVVAGDVQDPVADQGWLVLDATLGGTDVQEGVIEGGVAAWRNFDGTDNNNPGYVVALSGANYQDMSDNGWSLSMTLRLEQGGSFLYWGGDNTNTAGGFNFAGDRRVGISLGASGNDYTATVVGSGGHVVTVTDGILNDTYIDILIEGAAGTTTFDVTINNTDTAAVLLSESGLSFVNGNSSTDADTGFMSGSSGGDNRELFIRSFELATVPEPGSLALLSLGGLALLRRRRA